MSCRGLSNVLLDVMDWVIQDQYRMIGQYMEEDGEKLLLFSLDDPIITRTETHVYVPEKADEEGVEDPSAPQEEVVLTETIQVFPASWGETVGQPITSIAIVSLLEQRHYSGEWDVLRPAQEIEELSILTSEELSNLMQEAEDIIERWSENSGA